MLSHLAVVLHLAVTGYMVGLIWFVQLVHYPLMERVGRDGYRQYQELHMQRTTWAVSPMLLELASCVGLFFIPGGSLTTKLAGAVLLAVIWGTTALASVPAHTALAQGFQPEQHRRLVITNWVRTLAWSGRLLIALWMLLEAPRGLAP